MLLDDGTREQYLCADGDDHADRIAWGKMPS